MKIINPNYHNLENKKLEFQENKPFPYIILDNFLESSFYEKLDTKLKINDYFQGGKKFNTNFFYLIYFSLIRDFAFSI